MNELNLLKEIEKILKENALDCSMEPETKTPPFGRVLLFLGNDTQSRERILEITAQNQDLGESLKEPPEPPRFARVQFELLLPFEVKEQSSNEVSSLLAYLNRMLELPGFEFDEVNSKIFYRYVLLTHGKGIDQTLLTGLVGVILLICNLFSDTIERIALGQNTFEELLNEMLQLTENMS